MDAVNLMAFKRLLFLVACLHLVAHSSAFRPQISILKLPTQDGVANKLRQEYSKAARPSRNVCGCPSGFISCAGQCYQRFNIKSNYSRARGFCQQLHPAAVLAVPRSPHENICVAGLAGRKSIWLGANDLKQKGLFVGEDGKGPVGTSSFEPVWSYGDPSNRYGASRCVEMDAEYKFGTWNDRPCKNEDNVAMCQL